MRKNHSDITNKNDKPNPFASLSIRNYRWYWIGAIIGPGVVYMQGVARGWLVYEMTDSAFLLGVVTACLGLPIICIVPFSGVIADRVDKRNMILFSESIMTISSLILTVLLFLHIVQVWHLIATTLGLGIGMALSLPSRQSIVAELVDHEHLANGIALYSLGANAMRILGPVLAGILVVFVGLEGVFLISLILSLVGPISMLRIKRKSVHQRVEKTNHLQDLVEGLKYIGRDRTVLMLIICAYVIALLGTNYITLLPVFVRDVFKLGADGLGFLTGAVATGAMICSIIVASLGNIKKKGWILMISSLIYGIALIVFALTPFFAAAVCILLVTGGANAICMMMNQTILQTNVTPQMLGRVTSLYVLSSGIWNLAGMPFGAMAEQVGISMTIIICGAALAVFGVALIFLAPRLKTL